LKFIYDNFDLLFDKAGSVEAFKKLILEMAVRGKLVIQDPNDEPASMLIEKISKEKEQLIKEGVLKKEKPLPPIKENEMPYELPNGWDWVRLGTIATYGQSRSIKPDIIKKDAWILELEDIEKNSSKLLKRIYFHERNSKSTKNSFDKGDVLYGKLRPYLNKVIVADQSGYSSSEIVPIKTYDFILPKYLMYSLRQKYFFDYVNNCTYGTKMPRLGTEDARKALISVPPLDEQKRIVQKIDEIFEMIPMFQKALEQRVNYERQLNQTSLNTLTNTSNREEFIKSVQFVANNFDSLYDTIENIKELRQAILTFAVQGKLVPQDSNDEPASVLVERITKEKERLIKEGLLKKEKPLPPIKEDEIPYELPDGWEWVKLGDLCYLVTDGKHGGCDEIANSGYYFLSAKDIVNGELSYRNAKQISDKDFYETHQRTNLEINDILLSNAGSIGKITIAQDNNPYLRKTTFQKSIAVIKAYKQFVNVKYLSYSISHDIEVLKILSQGTSIKNLLLRDIKLIKIPLPPLKEQNLIVEKIDELMALCDDLENRIAKCRGITDQLLGKVLNEVFAGVS
jgi:type I restriction enzyme, S subunit